MKYSTTARNGKEDKKEEILKVATKLFTVQGYSKTGMRQIAKEANVSLALITYYFSTKDEIARLIARQISSQNSRCIDKYVDVHEDPILHLGVLVNLDHMVFSSKDYAAFYKDILREDIMLDVIASSGLRTYTCIRNKYCPDMSDQEIKRLGWYGNHISVSLERTLVLYADHLNLIQEPIPNLVFDSFMSFWKFPQVDEILKKKKEECRELAERILKENPELLDWQMISLPKSTTDSDDDVIK
ncbi:TetR/AcrR family transcriptional regulator [uncultured Clostridium sp.]|uniref:TetR/AcrR family transcriptional regulator n=1 Tax=uncultured Clostridium sp. TaxID=59620 RepID=UPI0025F20BBD|nr:TetR family transcriptional regulator [uncultured Clostridium sp.]